MVEEYQYWLHIKLTDSLPNSYSIYFPSGIPSVSFPWPLLNFLTLTLSPPLSFLPSLLPLPSSPLFSRCPSLFSVPNFYLPTSTKPHTGSPSISVYVWSIFLTSSSVVWLTEKCLICRAFLLDSSWSKMSATPPGATGTWYSTMVACWSCSPSKIAVMFFRLDLGILWSPCCSTYTCCCCCCCCCCQPCSYTFGEYLGRQQNNLLLLLLFLGSRNS